MPIIVIPAQSPAHRLPPPFSIRLLEHSNLPSTDSLRSNHPDQLLYLLPASYRKASGDVVAAARNVTACIEKELNLDRLTIIHRWLWVAGRPLPPRALHHQLLLNRGILITEQMDMHLVWTAGRIFLKPIPRFLLEPNFWAEYLSCERDCECSSDETTQGFHAVTLRNECKRRGLRRRALGFLFSYTALLTHESDFRIAQDKHLLPEEVTWRAWRVLIEQLDPEHIYPHIDRRFVHGELRLSRLNKIYALYQTPLRGYLARWDRYGAFLRENFAGLASLTVYIAIVLTAMQVGLATEALERSPAFQSASYGFTLQHFHGDAVLELSV
ncbi:hypothetical protein ASPACDRAFT_1880666 [Aspergillus aculeatus ATCC 16872]|uniref:Uncharacterized protein n=1 Tax=Aspergillus aculeatus (strain ATCC 16872 / CBS 172.66 / WB 5094) TaxID=690307 RepID=A0A1L9WW45_ASPA1|nr:uncharacterized protein ASPACDRAFT_1880666 [Aspergillus aculeatus ATCC 16872]OJK00246.1 hypothetical protein ASPACDRAFT_1880666 [Aspergillus aculeatus ATCC 16872]